MVEAEKGKNNNMVSNFSIVKEVVKVPEGGLEGEDVWGDEADDVSQLNICNLLFLANGWNYRFL